MSSSSSKSVFWRGVRDGMPFTLVIAPFAVLFGVVATEAGLNVFEVLSFSVVVIAGAAQFTALQLMQENAPTVVVLASALAVNLRLAMYSASLVPYLGKAPLWQRALVAYLTVDQSYATAMIKYENEPEMPLNEKVRYFIGCVIPVVTVWYITSMIGALVGTALPDGLAIDFAVPITFLALTAPMLRTLAHVAAALVAVATALVFAFLPYNLGLIVAGIAGMMTGAQVELWMTRRAAP
ncbi:AzlC family ABC transporter permease [Shimia biformata]|uniref:AzlC family ABC transporter permease n=1 Tax=Shimia biformata TaxID=1294299 RepID=UPI001951C4C1|nr:AzlC family ABC transporter permease [Shimia biformata]